MRADPEEYLGTDIRRNRFPLVELLLALAVIAGLVAFWFWSDEKNPAVTAAQAPPVAAPDLKPQLPSTPDIPQRPESATVVIHDVADAPVDTEIGDDQVEPANTAPLTPEDGDALLRRQLKMAGADGSLDKLMRNEHPLDVSAALIDGLGRGLILRKMLPATPPSQAFTVVQEGDTVYMSSASYERYDSYTESLTSVETGVLVDTFHSLRPLYEKAFEQLGLEADDFDNAVIRTLDLVLATPEIAEPIALKTKSVVYIYADPALEGLPAVQKQLLRMGPDNIRRIKNLAQTLRAGLLAQ